MTLVTPFCDPRHIQRPKPDIASLASCPIWPGIEAVNSAAQFEKTEHSAPDGTSRCRVLSFWRHIGPEFALSHSQPQPSRAMVHLGVWPSQPASAFSVVMAAVADSASEPRYVVLRVGELARLRVSLALDTR